ncbi:peptidylprolyl isomerase [Blastococcus sp. TF02A-26]|uniref:peptidylprolyl isomerase n=1 Tax=Blastococcus sp. TF02A-26 TaxID=2250577 RepID=UPI00131440E7|nr:peptidylprolyl isomerase [Blastococcus sp. TF02A-26]
MRTRRPAVLALALLAAVGLAGCRTSPNVAAYVGDETVTVDELDRAVQAHREDPDVTAGEGSDYRRTILTELVRSEVFSSAAEHFGVPRDPGGLEDLLTRLLGGTPPEEYFAQAGAQGYSREDALERVRQVAVLQAIAVAEGEAEEPTENSLRATYQQRLAEQPAQLDLGYVNVPDQETADAVVAALQADPASYAAVAQPYLDQATLPQPKTVAVEELTSELPPDLAARVATTPPGTVFATPVEQLPGVLVVVVAPATVPPFEEVRAQLEAAATNAAADAGAALLAEYEATLDIDVNPRYGSFDEGGVVRSEGGVVQLLGTED